MQLLLIDKKVFLIYIKLFEIFKKKSVSDRPIDSDEFRN